MQRKCGCSAPPRAKLCELMKHVVVEAGNFFEVSVEGTLTPSLDVVQLAAFVPSR